MPSGSPEVDGQEPAGVALEDDDAQVADTQGVSSSAVSKAPSSSRKTTTTR